MFIPLYISSLLLVASITSSQNNNMPACNSAFAWHENSKRENKEKHLKSPATTFKTFD